MKKNRPFVLMEPGLVVWMGRVQGFAMGPFLAGLVLGAAVMVLTYLAATV